MKKNQKNVRKVVASSANRRTRRQTLRSALPELLESRMLMSTYSVTTTADSGAGSLRQAIMNVNGDSSPDLITFNIAGSGVQTVSLNSSLPAITNTVTIDGTSQTGYAGTPLIELNGSGANGAGLDFEAGSAGSKVMGLTIDSFSGAGVVLNSGGASLSNNYIGTDPTGTFAEANNDGVDIDSNGNTLSGNLISGNNYNGVSVSGDGNTLTGNLIGTDFTGTQSVGNSGDGSIAGSGGVYVMNASNTLIGGSTASARNVISGNFEGGVVFVNDSGSGNVVEGNYIGLDVTGEAAQANFDAGIDLGTTDGLAVSNVSILDNVISGNFYSGIYLNTATNNLIQGNLIGTDATGHDSFSGIFSNQGNENDGITIDVGSTGNLIGGTTAASRNLIDGNYANGITVVGAGSSNTVEGNFIGVDASGQVIAANLGDGILVDAGLLTIGGSTPGSANVISGDDGVGVDLEGGTSVVDGNLIGVASDGATALGNGGDGVRINQSSGNTIGGDAAGQGNIIAFNGALSAGRGVNVVSGVKNAIEGNSIYSNSTLGIDLGNDGVTANDSQGHAGPNNYQDFPVLDSTVGNDGTTATVTGTMTGPAGATFTIDFYTDTTADPSGYGQGQVFQGSESVTIGSDGTAQVSFSADTPAGTVWTATATDSLGNTSEFALDVTEGQPTSQPNSISGVVTTDLTGNGFSADDTPLAGVTIDLFANGGSTPLATTVSGSDGTYSFTGLGAGSYTVQEVVPTGSTETGGTSGYTIAAISGTNSTGSNFDNFQNVTISGTVYNDLTGNGITGDDTALAGVTIQLSSGSTVVASTTSAANGTYSFTNVVPGSYTVAELVPTGSTQTVGNGGYGVVAQSGHNVTGDNFADFQRISLSGTVYNDVTGNGFSSDDTPMSGVTVNLFLNGGTTAVATTATAANGTYSFPNLGPGTYSVQEVVPPGWTQTGAKSAVVATSGSNVTGQNFDNYLPPSGAINGYVFCDDNLDGVFDATQQDNMVDPEAGEGGATVTLTGSTTAGASVSLTTTTASNGYYSFSGLAAGTYTVSLTGFSPNHQAEQSHGSVTILETSKVTLTAGQTLSGPAEGAATKNNGLDFAEIAPGGLEGFVWDDANNDGNIDYNEAGIVNVTIQLNGVTYTGAKVSESTVTDENGQYIFTNLQPGTYTLTESTPSGFTDGKDSVGSLGGSETYLSNCGSNSGCSTGSTNCGSNCNNSSCGSSCYNDCYGNYGYNCFTNYSNNCYSNCYSSNCGQSNNCGNCGGNSSNCNSGSNCGWNSGCNNAQNSFSSVQIGGCEDVGVGYNFGETGGKLSGCTTDTASLAFWHNSYGQALLCSLNGGPNSTALGTWLATMFPNMYGSGAKVNFAGMTNVQIAAFYNSNDFNVTGIKLDAAVLSAALSSYVTNTTWAGGSFATKYGFAVSAQGVGYDSINVGSDGVAFGVSNNSTITILQALDATDQLSQGDNGVLYGGSTTLRSDAYAIYAAIAQNGLTS